MNILCVSLGHAGYMNLHWRAPPDFIDSYLLSLFCWFFVLKIWLISQINVDVYITFLIVLPRFISVCHAVIWLLKTINNQSKSEWRKWLDIMNKWMKVHQYLQKANDFRGLQLNLAKLRLREMHYHTVKCISLSVKPGAYITQLNHQPFILFGVLCKYKLM